MSIQYIGFQYTSRCRSYPCKLPRLIPFPKSRHYPDRGAEESMQVLRLSKNAQPTEFQRIVHYLFRFFIFAILHRKINVTDNILYGIRIREIKRQERHERVVFDLSCVRVCHVLY